jgi:tetratricopeptide (TPR) repeat protein
MKGIRLFLLFLSLIVLSACANMRVAQDVSYGRQAFLVGNNEVAVGYFQRAADANPNYVYGADLRQGVLSYLGRSEYALGRLPQARQTLQRAITTNKDEDIARLYLGLTLLRSGDQQGGIREIESGMKGIHAFLEYVTETFRFSYGQFWDPNLEIRKAIRNDLAMISSKEFDLQKLIANGEWLGKEIEEEIDRARRDEIRDRDRQSDSPDSQP